MRTLSAAMNAAIFSESSSEVILQLVAISHPLISTIYLCDDLAAHTSNGIVYEPENFTVQLPDDGADGIPNGLLTIQSVDRSYIESLSLALTAEAATVTYSLVLASTPDTVEVGPEVYKIRSLVFDDYNLSAGLSIDLPGDEPFPGIVFDPKNNPGLFKDF